MANKQTVVAKVLTIRQTTNTEEAKATIPLNISPKTGQVSLGMTSHTAGLLKLASEGGHPLLFLSLLVLLNGRF